MKEVELNSGEKREARRRETKDDGKRRRNERIRQGGSWTDQGNRTLNDILILQNLSHAPIECFRKLRFNTC